MRKNKNGNMETKGIYRYFMVAVSVSYTSLCIQILLSSKKLGHRVYLHLLPYVFRWHRQVPVFGLQHEWNEKELEEDGK